VPDIRTCQKILCQAGLTAIFLSVILSTSEVGAAPSPELWARWQVHTPESKTMIDHDSWSRLLKKYLVTDHPSGIHRFRYGSVSAADAGNLAQYVERLEKTPVSSLNRDEQKAYWVNLYNALTVKVILDHYPVKSITDIDISPGFFSNGPWDARLLSIEGEKVSLNDIEHRILRPIFKDNRLHYALNCASLGCPNLQPVAFTAANTEDLLEVGARAYINSPRGARMFNGDLRVSSIYKWFQIDFGGSERGVIDQLTRYADPGLAKVLQTYDGRVRYDYDWALNEPE